MKSLAATIWDLLGRVQTFKLSATTLDQSSFFHNATASGSVAVSRPRDGGIRFHETGSWRSRERQTVDFRNTYHWSLSIPESVIRLTHLRYGPDKPVHLVDLVSRDADRMQSFQPHRCGADQYSATLGPAGDRILLSWTIVGPSKNDTLECWYFT